ncbi:MAG: fibronectin type III domain-containing protein, partial [Planctomycetaceae bacterium]
TISDGSLNTSSDVTVTVSQTLTSITVTPVTVTINTGTTKQFAATAKDQFGNALVSQPAFVWSVSSGGGSISSAGLFTAPATAGTSVVRAASGAISGTATVTIAVPVPAAPTTLKLTAISRTQINLSWLDKSSNESGFLIERSLDGINFTQVAMVGPNIQAWSATGLVANTRYYFRVRAWNSGGNSAWSSIASIKTKP